MVSKKRLTAILCTICFILPAADGLAMQPLETETARIPPAGTIEIELTGEYQNAPDGNEISVPIGIEYAITNDLAVLVEPVPFTAIMPFHGSHAYSLGDVEVTTMLRIVKENGFVPAIALAGEIKFPTADNPLIGTGATDYTAYLIASKRVGPVDIHLNLGYSVIGRIPGVDIKNTVDFAGALEYFATEKLTLVTEVVGNTAATSNAEGTENSVTVTPEIAGFEVAGMLGMRYQVVKGLFLCFGATYDNNQAVLVRPGLTWKFMP